MLNIVCILCLLFSISVTPVLALEQIERYVPEAQKVGHGRLTVMVWDVYDASLYAPKGQWSRNVPFALHLSYLRDISGRKIADHSIEEMRRQGFRDEVKMADWHTQMMNIFPDVDNNTSLTGVYTQDGQTVFFKGKTEIGRINDPLFGQYFFNIWLGENTNVPDLKHKLLGQS